ncbi:carboxymuconolactone decarboxylase family protein [Demequina sp. SO4-18]|uniref:carboxymuconolactone decarboxylase family protein n=1 Tax=Demequina sp. SO4-18 TaxID=3401026 RepID=UPI003B5B3981
MTHVDLISHETATGPAGDTLQRIDSAFGTVPAMFQAVANSPAALNSMWGSFGALSQGTLGAAIGEQIAVAVANRNSCEYCLAAHTALGRKADVSVEVLADAQEGRSDDPRIEALLQFALAVVDERGHITAAQLAAVRRHGWSDEAIVETMAHVALNLFTNYVNVALDVPVDFPAVSLRHAA